MCPWYYKGKCDRGKSCRFAHSDVEIRNLPDLSKTSLCPTFMKTSTCTNPNCRFAHNFDELRATDNMYKTSLCFMFMKSRCEAGNQCRHAHGNHELRPKPPGFEYIMKDKIKNYNNTNKEMKFVLPKNGNEEGHPKQQYIQRMNDPSINCDPNSVNNEVFKLSNLYNYLDKVSVSNQSTAYTTIEKPSKLEGSTKQLFDLSNTLRSTWNSDSLDSQEDQDYYFVRVCPAISEPPISAIGRNSLESYLPNDYPDMQPNLKLSAKSLQIPSYPDSNNTYSVGDQKFDNNGRYLMSYPSTPSVNSVAKPPTTTNSARNAYTNNTSALLHHITEAAQNAINPRSDPKLGSSWFNVIEPAMNKKPERPKLKQQPQSEFWAQSTESFSNDCPESYQNSLENVYTNYLMLLSDQDSPESVNDSLDDSKHLRSAISNILAYNTQSTDQAQPVAQSRSGPFDSSADIKMQLANLLDCNATNSELPENKVWKQNSSSINYFDSSKQPEHHEKYNSKINKNFCLDEVPDTPAGVNV